MIHKEGSVNTVTGDILNIFIVHYCIDKPVTQEVLVHIVKDNLTLDRCKLNTKIKDDICCCSP